MSLPSEPARGIGSEHEILGRNANPNLCSGQPSHTGETDTVTFRSRRSARRRPALARPRTLAAAVAVIVSLAGLTACRTNVGDAAAVGGRAIPVSQVDRYTLPGGPDAATKARAKQAGSDLSPKAQVLQVLVQEQVFERTLKAKSAVPTEAQLASLHDRAAGQLLQTSLTGAKFDNALRKGLTQNGVRPSFRSHFLRMLELEVALIVASRATSLAQLAATVARYGGKVSVNPRYGAWDPANLALSANPNSGVPGFVQLQGASSTGPRATAGQ